MENVLLDTRNVTTIQIVVTDQMNTIYAVSKNDNGYFRATAIVTTNITLQVFL